MAAMEAARMKTCKELSELGRLSVEATLPPKMLPVSYREVSADVPERETASRYRYRFDLQIGCRFTEGRAPKIEIAKRAARTLHYELYGSTIAKMKDIQETMYAEGLTDTDSWKLLSDLIDASKA